MDELIKKKCVPCEGGVLPFDVSEIHKYQKKVDGWEISQDEKKIFFLNKKFNFKNFWIVKTSLIKLGKSRKMRGITQTYHLVGVMRRLKLRLML